MDPFLAELKRQVDRDEQEAAEEREDLETWAAIGRSSVEREEREEREAKAAKRAAKRKPEPEPEAEQSDLAQLRRDAEKAKVAIAEIERKFGSKSQHLADAKADYQTKQTAVFQAEGAEFDRAVRQAAETDVRQRATAQVQQELERERKAVEASLANLKSPVDRQWFGHSWRERHGQDWIDAEVEARVRRKMGEFETGMVERNPVTDHSRPRPLSPTEVRLAQIALADRSAEGYVAEILGSDWRSRL